jgi:cardiolipin synthase
VKVYLYEAGFLHSKMLVCDDAITTCGSTNFDFRSFENNFEANIFFFDEGVALRMKNIFLRDQEQTIAFEKAEENSRGGFLVRLWESATRMLSPLF